MLSLVDYFAMPHQLLQTNTGWYYHPQMTRGMLNRNWPRQIEILRSIISVDFDYLKLTDRYFSFLLLFLWPA